MKISLALVILVSITSFANSKYKWERISFYHSSGHVSPEFQYSYIITVDDDGHGKLEYTKSGKTSVFDFKVKKIGMSNLNTAIIKSKVLKVSSDEIGKNSGAVGNPVYSGTVTLPFPDEKEDEEEKEKNPVIIIPNNLNKEYSAGVNDLYYVIENLVPNSIWDQAAL